MIKNANEIYSFINKLEPEKIDYSLVNQLTQLERNMTSENWSHIKSAAKSLGESLISNPDIILAENTKDLIFQRYIITPILYKLGYNHQAANLGQKTLEKLFPRIHEIILGKLHTIYGPNLIENACKILDSFSLSNDNIKHIDVRPIKSTNSIWKKVQEFSDFVLSDKEYFVTNVHDLVALRWCVELKKHENYFDTLINAIKLLPTKGIKTFRNQYLKQSEGFSLEPVFKFRYVIESMPVECQILAGDINFFLSAKGYADYKTNFIFPPRLSDLSPSQSSARLGLCVYYQQFNMDDAFRRLMLNEMINDDVIEYDARYQFYFEDQPSHKQNRNLYFSEHLDQPIYRLNGHRFNGELLLHQS